MKRTLAASVVVACVLSMPTGAGASSGTAATGSVTTGVRASGAQVGPSTDSRYLAGYELSSRHGVSEMVIKQVTTPQLSCGDRFEGVALGAGSEPTVGVTDYFAGVVATCVGGQPVYALAASVGDVETQAPGVVAGDNLQIVILIDCDGGSCDVSAGVVNTTQPGQDVRVSQPLTPSVKTASYGAFPVFGDGSRPVRVPDFGTVLIEGCQFNGHGLRNREPLVRKHGTTLQIEPGTYRGLSFPVVFKHR